MFLDQKAEGAPFCFWYGAKEPHRKFDPGVGLRNGGSLEDVEVPEFLPDTETVRSELLDYAYEINWFDSQLGKMLEELEKRGELSNTIVIVTSDNGMAFPRAKANCYEFGIHIPLTVSWPREWAGGRIYEDLISLIDLTPTILDAAGHSIEDSRDFQGRSILPLLTGSSEVTSRDHVLSGRERHSSSRFGNLGYPQRSLRTKTHLLVWNCEPGRWPAGSPVELGKEGERLTMHEAYYDIDRSPTLSELIESRDDDSVQSLFTLAVGKRPEFELYDIKSDPSCLNDLSSVQPELTERLKRRLMDELSKQRDPRLLGEGEVWDAYERYGSMRSFPKPSPEN